jgi:hypothetical protein
MERKLPAKLFSLFTAAIVLAGCAGPVKKPAIHCPGKKTADESIAALNAHRRNFIPVRATGQCLLRYRRDDKDHKENFPIKIWTSPPEEIYMQGDVAFNATGLVLGTNNNEFWFWLKPKEISSYWWGKWSQAGEFQKFPLSPDVCLEAFGAANIATGDWSLTHGQFDILWLYNEQGELVKRIYIETCDYLVAKIEYFDSSGQIAVSAEFSDYKKVAVGFFIPASIEINAAADDGSINSAKISLASVKAAGLNERQRQRLFVRPEPQGFEHIYEIIDGSAVEQTGQ